MFQEDFFKCKTFEERMDLLCEKRPENADYKGYERSFCLTLYGRLKAVIDYEPTYPKIKSEVIFYKARYNELKCSNFDYNIEYLCEHVEEIVVENNHQTILKNSDIIKKINDVVKSV